MTPSNPLHRALELARELKRRKPWSALQGPQTMAYESTADIVGYGGAAGGGKGLALTTPIATPTGWTVMGNLSVGDWVFDETGKPCQVTAVSEINHRPCYRLAFDDGSIIVADDVHRWVTFDAKELGNLTKRDPEWQAQRRAKRPSRANGNKSEKFAATIASRNAARAALAEKKPLPTGTMRDTLEIFNTLRTKQGRANHAIRVCGALQLPDAVLPVPAYTMGAWLGDGSSRNSQITGIDPEVWENIEADGFKVVHYEWSDKAHNVLGLAAHLRDAGVLKNKHIPMQYLRASFGQRLALLQGLMDTDGHAATDGGCEYDGINDDLVWGVYELALSLGIKATLQVGNATLNGRWISPKYRVKFVTDLPVFRIKRKLERQGIKPLRRTGKFRYLTSCEPVNSVPTRCISVDSPSRQYLAGVGLAPTHNSDLVCGKALTKHKRVLVIRREKAQTEGILQRLGEIIGSTDGLNAQKGIWRVPVGTCPLIEFGGLDNPGDERRWQGRPHDLKCFDEVTEQREDQVRFIMGWTRTSDPTLHPQVIMTFNPPTTSEGRWVIKFFAPWLDKKHPNPAAPGELRWFTTIGNDQDYEVPDGRPFVIDAKGEFVYDFDSTKFKPEQIITPKSRTFIPARVTDNKFYMASGYVSQLQSLPEPLRSQMLYGDFNAGVEDDPWQVIPTAWVDAAMARWRLPDVKPRMDSVGVDVARGGRDNTVIARRHGMWFDLPLTYPGSATPDGPTVAGLTIAATRDNAPQHIDVIGVGASPYDFLNSAGQQVIGVNVAEKATTTDKSGRLHFANLRTQLWWKFREALDPTNNTGIALPNDSRLKADLCAPCWRLKGSTIQVESREEIIDRIGRSPDYAAAYCLALIDTPRIEDVYGHSPQRSEKRREYNPY